MFEFRIVNQPDGSQIIDNNLKTPYSSLTFEQFQEYMEVSKCVEFIELLKIRKRGEAEHKKKFVYRFLCMWYNIFMYIYGGIKL